MVASLEALTSPDAAATSGSVLAVPFGSTEQHGPHLPLATDSDIALALCERLAQQRDIIVAPPVTYGSSGEHAGFAGTISIGQKALELLALELGRSASESFGHLLFVSGHGGNAAALTRAVDRLRIEGRDVLLFLPKWTGEPHAGRAETSMELALHPDRVVMASAEMGNVRPLRELLPLMRADGVRAVAANGVLGDPRPATASEGVRLLDALSANLLGAVDDWRAAEALR